MSKPKETPRERHDRLVSVADGWLAEVDEVLEMRIDNDDRTRLFGPPCTPANHQLYLTPWGIRVQVHRKVAVRFSQACVEARRESSWRPQRIDGYNCRTIRGGKEHSIHAWAMAFDFFATPPNVFPPGGVWTPDDPPDAVFVKAFTDLGFTWGGTFTRKDTPHIEWAGKPPSATPAETEAPEQPEPPPAWHGPITEADVQPHREFPTAPLGSDGTGVYDFPHPGAKVVSVHAEPPDPFASLEVDVPVCTWLEQGENVRVIVKGGVPNRGYSFVVWTT